MENVVIIGSGCAGNTAAIYAARASLNPLLYEGREAGGQLSITTDVENYPGFPTGVMGPDLVENMKKQAQRFGARFTPGEITKVNLSERPFTLWAESIGGGDSAMEEATFLTKFATEVTIVHRRNEFRASKIMLDRARENNKIRWAPNTIVKEVYDVDRKEVTGLRLCDTRDGSERDHPTSALFLAIGHIPNTRIFEGQIDLDEDGYILSTGGARTNIKGVFHAGDVEDRVYRQAITAAGAGCKAAIEAERFLETLS